MSQAAQARIKKEWKKLHLRTPITIQEIASEINPQMVGIIRYYGKFRLWAMRNLMRHFHYRLAKWVLKKYKRFKGSYRKAYGWLKEIQINYPTMFYQWTIFSFMSLHDKSRMK